MTRAAIIFGFIFCLLVGAVSSAFAGAWTLPQGEAEMHFAAVRFASDKFYDEQHDRQPIDRYSKLEASAYGEYGLRDDITLGANIAANLTTADGIDEWNPGLADPEIFLRKQVWKGDFSVVSIQPLIKFPSISRDNDLPRSGTQEWDTELRLLAGTGFEWFDRNQYLDAGLGYRKRFGDAADQVRFDLTLGLRLLDRWTFMPQLFSIWRTEKSDRSFRTQIFDNDYNLIKAQFSAVYAITDSFALQGGFFHDAYGQNIGQGNGFFIATWHRF